MIAFAVPKASAQQAATLVRWEYFCRFNLSEEEFTSMGAERWELTTVAVHERGSVRGQLPPHERYCFKRPKM